MSTISYRTTLNRRLASDPQSSPRYGQFIQSQIEFQDIYQRFPQQTKLSRLRMLLYQIANC